MCGTQIAALGASSDFLGCDSVFERKSMQDSYKATVLLAVHAVQGLLDADGQAHWPENARCWSYFAPLSIAATSILRQLEDHCRQVEGTLVV